MAVPGDLTSASFCRDLVQQAVDGMGGLDAIVNVAGVQVWQESIDEITDEQFDRTFKTNVYAPFWIIKAALPHLQPGSTIVNTASLEAYTPAPDRLDYATTKGAINNFSKGLAQQLVAKGIRVNVVAPGPTWSVLQVTSGVDPETLPEFGSSESPIGRARSRPSRLRRTCSSPAPSRASSRARRSTSTAGWSRRSRGSPPGRARRTAPLVRGPSSRRWGGMPAQATLRPAESTWWARAESSPRTSTS